MQMLRRRIGVAVTELVFVANATVGEAARLAGSLSGTRLTAGTGATRLSGGTGAGAFGAVLGRGFRGSGLSLRTSCTVLGRSRNDAKQFSGSLRRLLRSLLRVSSAHLPLVAANQIPAVPLHEGNVRRALSVLLSGSLRGFRDCKSVDVNRAIRLQLLHLSGVYHLGRRNSDLGLANLLRLALELDRKHVHAGVVKIPQEILVLIAAAESVPSETVPSGSSDVDNPVALEKRQHRLVSSHDTSLHQHAMHAGKESSANSLIVLGRRSLARETGPAVRGGTRRKGESHQNPDKGKHNELTHGNLFLPCWG